MENKVLARLPTEITGKHLQPFKQRHYFKSAPQWLQVSTRGGGCESAAPAAQAQEAFSRGSTSSVIQALQDKL